MILPNICLLYMQEAKSINHLFLHCPFASEVWSRFLKEISLAWVSLVELSTLISSWHIWGCPIRGKTLWKLTCPAVCWEIWLERNRRAFEDHAEPALNVYLKAKDFACLWGLNCGLEDDYSAASMKRNWPNLFLRN